jgi:hypothetical protein
VSAARAEQLKLVMTGVGLVTALWGGLKFPSKAGAFVASAQAQGAQIAVLQARVTEHDKAVFALSYMTCVTFAETHPPAQVPTYCVNYTRAP